MNLKCLNEMLNLIFDPRNCISKAENPNEIIFTHDENYDSGYNAIDDEDAFLNSNGH